MEYEKYVGTIIKVATKYQTNDISRDELIAEGNLVFCESVKAYDPECKTKFNSFLFGNLRNRFINIHRDKKSKVKGGLQLSSEVIHEATNREQHNTEDLLEEMSRELSEGAEEVVNFILNTSDAILKELNVGTVSKQGLRITKKGLKKYFTKVRMWKRGKWISCSHEIKKFLVVRI